MDFNTRIAAVVKEEHQRQPVRSLAIWGYTPGVYVQTGLVPATRDAVAAYAIIKGPYQEYFRERFLKDLDHSKPEMFVDTVTSGAFLWPEWTEEDGYESYSDLRDFIAEYYVPVRALELGLNQRPVQFFRLRPVPASHE